MAGILKSIFTSGSKAIASTKAAQYFSGGVKGTLRLGGAGLGIGASYWAYSDTYGGGAATLYGIGGALPGVGLGILAGEAGMLALEWGNKVYKNRRTINIGSPLIDNFGTSATMKMHSIQSLSRNRASVNRFIGNEASYYHRR